MWLKQCHKLSIPSHQHEYKGGMLQFPAMGCLLALLYPLPECPQDCVQWPYKFFLTMVPW